MNAYLESKNRAVRNRKLRDRAFEFFISHIEVLFPVLTVVIYVTLILLGILGLANLACSPVR